MTNQTGVTQTGRKRKDIGLAIVGCGTIGRIRGVLARDYPGVAWIGLCDTNERLGRKLAEDTQADFFTTRGLWPGLR